MFLMVRVPVVAINQDIDLFDLQRQRPVPVRIWIPEGAPRAWVIFSVGFGGERSGYAYLGRAWAAMGIVTAVVEHFGSNLSVLKTLPGKTRDERNREVSRQVGDPQELAARPRDLRFVHDSLVERFPGLPLGLAGHSYGTYTILASLGLPTLPIVPPLVRPLEETRCCLLMSPQPPGSLFSERALRLQRIPTLVMSGTRDSLLSGDGDYTARVAAYHALPAELRNLAVLDGVEHMAFAAIGLSLGPTLRVVEGLTGQWWESTLLGRVEPPAARARRLAEAAGETRGDFR